MQTMKGISIPVIADGVLSPQVFYGRFYLDEPRTGIYFVTNNGGYGRITFENLDAIRVCRGETNPYEYDCSQNDAGIWVFKVENSMWLQERSEYKNSINGSTNESGGDINDTMMDFNHYYFSFHDEFVEVIARGFWFEEDKEGLFGKPLKQNHPFLSLPEEGYEILECGNLNMQVRKNRKSEEQLKVDSQYCSQKLMEFVLEIDGRASVDNTLILSCRNGKLITSLVDCFGNEMALFDRIATLDDVLPYLEKYSDEVYEHRKKLGQEE